MNSRVWRAVSGFAHICQIYKCINVCHKAGCVKSFPGFKLEAYRGKHLNIFFPSVEIWIVLQGWAGAKSLILGMFLHFLPTGKNYFLSCLNKEEEKRLSYILSFSIKAFVNKVFLVSFSDNFSVIISFLFSCFFKISSTKVPKYCWN